MATEIDQLTTEIATLESQISAITAAAAPSRPMRPNSRQDA